MVKKYVIGGSALVLVLALFFGRDAVSYVATTVGWMKDSVRESVPINFEIERARKMIAELQPEIRRNMHLIAKEEVDVERLHSQVEDLKARQGRSETELMRLKDHLDSGKDYFYHAGRRYSEDEVKTDVANRFARFKTNDATLGNLQRVLLARERSLDAARQKLENMLAARRNLMVDVENLEARQKMVEVAQTTSDFNFDNSQLAQTKELITRIRTRIDVTEKMVNAEAIFHDEIPLDEPTEENLAAKIDEYFNVRLPAIEALADHGD